MLGRCTDEFIYAEVDGLVRRLRCLAGGPRELWARRGRIGECAETIKDRRPAG
jgi:hypothetical protein